MEEFTITLPFERLLIAAKVLGTQEVDLCPPVHAEHDGSHCWLHRGLDPFLYDGDPIDNSCTECWLRFFTNGD